MKKILYILLLSPIFALGQCSLPSMYEGVTSSNMMTVNFEYYFNPPSELTEGAYLVALTETGQVVGSTYIYENSESTISVYDLGTYTSVFFKL